MERKVYSGGIAGAITAIGFWVLSFAAPEVYSTVNAEIAAAFTVIVNVFISWLVPNPQPVDQPTGMGSAP